MSTLFCAVFQKIHVVSINFSNNMLLFMGVYPNAWMAFSGGFPRNRCDIPTFKLFFSGVHLSVSSVHSVYYSPAKKMPHSRKPVTQNVKECFGRHCAVSCLRGKRNEIHPRPQAFHAPQAHFTQRSSISPTRRVDSTAKSTCAGKCFLPEDEGFE